MSVLSICDTDEEYSADLADYLRARCKQCRDIKLDIRTYSTPQLLADAPVSDIAIVPEELLESVGECARIILTKRLCKAQDIWHDIADALAGLGATSGDTGATASVYAFYTPISGCLQTTLALTWAQILSESGRTLYLNFEHYAGFGRLLDPGTQGDISQLLYYAGQPDSGLALRLQSLAGRIGQVEYVPPAYAGQTLIEVPPEDWLNMLTRLKSECGYSHIVLDMSCGLRGAYDILRQCNRIYTIVRDDALSAGKLSQYKVLLNEYGYSDVIENTVNLSVPYDIQIPASVEMYPQSQLGEYARHMLA